MRVKAVSMARKPIPDAVQNAILLKSRRRCCLCFWLEGKDEVLKGQIAHLDHNNENSAEDNLCFLCFNHHDEYDGSTRLAKGLKESEVRHWRDALHKEMRYRFQNIKTYSGEVRIENFIWFGGPDHFGAMLKVKNSGETDLVSPTVSIQLPESVGGELPKLGNVPDDFIVRNAQPFQTTPMKSQVQDLFEENGKIGIKQAAESVVIHPDHSMLFWGLSFRVRNFPFGSQLNLNYRIDSRGSQPIRGQLSAIVPSSQLEFTSIEAALRSPPVF